MNSLQITPSYVLLDVPAPGRPRLMHRQSGATYPPDEIVEIAPSWGPMPARNAVQRATRGLNLYHADRAMVDRFCQ